MNVKGIHEYVILAFEFLIIAFIKIIESCVECGHFHCFNISFHIGKG